MSKIKHFTSQLAGLQTRGGVWLLLKSNKMGVGANPWGSAEPVGVQ